VVAGEGLRSVGAASPSKSVCSILPLARHLRAGEVECVIPGPRPATIIRGASEPTSTALPRLPPGCTSPSAWTRASAKYNGGAVGYLIWAAEGQRSVNLTDPEWRALIYLASLHGFSAPHLRLEGEDESLEVDASDAEGLRSALGKALEARDKEEISTPDGELYYDTIQRVRHVLLSEGVRLARPRA
jgi:hypothetical protein